MINVVFMVAGQAYRMPYTLTCPLLAGNAPPASSLSLLSGCVGGGAMESMSVKSQLCTESMMPSMAAGSK